MGIIKRIIDFLERRLDINMISKYRFYRKYRGGTWIKVKREIVKENIINIEVWPDTLPDKWIHNKSPNSFQVRLRKNNKVIWRKHLRKNSLIFEIEIKREVYKCRQSIGKH